MSILTEQQKQLLPSNPILKEATLNAFKKVNGVDMSEVENFLNQAGGNAAADPIGATATLGFAGIMGHITVKPISVHANCKFDHDFWGVGVIIGKSIGFMYTAYTNWDAFFRNITSFIVVGGAEEGGVLQVTFLRSDALPMGQFNGIMEGLGILGGGGAGTWAC
jgi:hypothetical protein